MLDLLIRKLFRDGTLIAFSNGVDVVIKANVLGAKITLIRMPIADFSSLEAEISLPPEQVAPKEPEKIEAEAVAPALPTRPAFRVIEGGA